MWQIVKIIYGLLFIPQARSPLLNVPHDSSGENYISLYSMGWSNEVWVPLFNYFYPIDYLQTDIILLVDSSLFI